MINTFPHRQSGLSLVELMIAITLSLLLIAGVLQIFLSSKQTYSTNNALSRVQESGRFAMDFLTQDIRNTGYKGQCMGEPKNHGVTEVLWRLDDPIEGWNDVETRPAQLPDTPAGTPVEGTDAILIKFAAGPEEMAAASSNTATNQTIDLGTNASGVAQHAITLISDAISCDLFRNTAATNATSVARAAGSEWTHDYTDITEVLPLQNATYYIRANSNGRPNSLVRQRLGVKNNNPNWLDPEELVDGVEDMQIQYGIAGLDRQVTDYVTADDVTDWGNVVAVRINLLVVSADTNVVPEDQVIAFNGDDVTIANRRLAQVFSTTISIRNRLP
ncbi:pilus assembly protein PilW [Pseudomonas sp. YY-1]|uniref:PilW family protein n=1 Tax=Pseudomonas sp. YY-1 TaxID=2058659 RepID=UPI000CBCE0C4|nr:PilW family protein [Pseudomonas sp. YY-1]PKQ42850.1 pilus assembly protein PilW [Pseudomonas sp. YY-1]